MDGISKKYREIFYIFSQHKKFESMVKDVRLRFKIKVNQREKLETTLDKYGDKTGALWEDAVYDVLFAVIPKYMKPEGDFLYTATETYILEGNEGVEKYLKGGFLYSFGVSLFKKLDLKWLKKFGDRYENGVFLYIPPYISKVDFKDVIDKKWPEIQKTFRQKNNKKYAKLMRIRSHTKNKRDKIIYDTYSRSRKELGLKRGQYKEIVVSNILKKEHGIEIQPESIKMVVYRYKKLRKGNI